MKLHDFIKVILKQGLDYELLQKVCHYLRDREEKLNEIIGGKDYNNIENRRCNYNMRLNMVCNTLLY